MLSLSMGEDFRYQLALMTAETMYMLWEANHQERERDLDGMMRRLKDLSAYALIHAEIMDQREGVEMLAIAMFFGMSSDERFHQNQERLRQLSEEVVVYEGSAQVIEEQVSARKGRKSAPKDEDDDDKPLQPRLL
jgi:uncharacterized LabA/DUF88 family protein